MEFFEFVFLFSLTVLLPIVVLRTVLDFKKAKVESERGAGDSAGVTVGELKRMLTEVVREANTPLIDRIEQLEHHAEIEPPASERFLDTEADFAASDYEESEFDTEAEAEKTLGRRLRG